MIDYLVKYKPQGQTIKDYHKSRAHHRVITGPLGSGKTTASVAEILRKIVSQPANKQGIRKSRWACIRNTYPELINTTINDWREVVGDEMGDFKKSVPITHSLSFELPDDTKVESEVLFLSADKDQDVGKLRGLQLTGAWLNELKELPKSILDMTFSRCGRYPTTNSENYWYGLIGDTNAPDTDHYLYKLAEVEKPEGWDFFKQPPAVIKVNGKWIPNENAENISNLSPVYYINQISGKSDDWIKVNLANEYGFVMQGKPVFAEYQDSVHCLIYEPKVDTNLIVYVGIDFGLTPAAIFGQRDNVGRWVVLDELVCEDMGAERLANEIKFIINQKYSGLEIKLYGDPAGEQRSQVDERTPFSLLRAKGLNAFPTHTNDFIIRREAVAQTMTKLVDGKNAFNISQNCTKLRKALSGGYCFKRIQVSGERYQDKPDKNQYSHIADALQYMMLGAGEGRAVIKSGDDYGTFDIVSDSW